MTTSQITFACHVMNHHGSERKDPDSNALRRHLERAHPSKPTFDAMISQLQRVKSITIRSFRVHKINDYTVLGTSFVQYSKSFTFTTLTSLFDQCSTFFATQQHAQLNLEDFSWKSCQQKSSLCLTIIIKKNKKSLTLTQYPNEYSYDSN